MEIFKRRLDLVNMLYCYNGICTAGPALPIRQDYSIVLWILNSVINTFYYKNDMQQHHIIIQFGKTI